MQVFQDIGDIRTARWSDPLVSWGLGPTMGFLHDGHLSLVGRAKDENDCVGVSIFVNPAQFNNPDDLTAYPTNMARDLELLEANGVDLVWTPSALQVYPPSFQTYVDVEQITLPLEGGSRAGHFRGVSTVVSKLFNVFEPQRAYFGQKDAQQALTVQRMVEDLNFNLDVVVCQTIREPDGLALSSRNARLTPASREQSIVLYRALQLARQAWFNGEHSAKALRTLMTDEVGKSPLAQLEYASVANCSTLEEMDHVDGAALFSIAALFEGVRLIDNVRIQ
jgi:pantoate--beta-alanine ligase